MYLPKKDAVLAEKFLNKRDFQSILELVESDLYKMRKRKSKGEDISEFNGDELTELSAELVNYISYLDIPEEDSDDYYDY